MGFLGITILNEAISAYPIIGYYTDFEYFGFTKNTRFERNFWFVNIYQIISFIIYILFFRFHLKSKRHRAVVAWLLIAFVISAIINLALSGIYFEAFSAYTNIVGTFLLLITIAIYYYQLLTSDAILEIKRSITFYISIGAIILHIALTPLLIYSLFFSKEANSPEFVELNRIMFRIINLLVYLIFTVGFIICRNKKSS